MTEEELIKRINTVKADMEVLRANYSKLEGHLEEANFWLKEMALKKALEKPVKENKVENVKKGGRKKKESAATPDTSLASLHQSE